MQNQTNNTKRKKEIIDRCLAEFIEHGLFSTSARDLANALQMQASGLYYYFKSKDELVVACAEEAGIRLEETLILPLFEYLDNTEHFMHLISERTEAAVPMMKFFAQACTTKEYRIKMQPVLERMQKRHHDFSLKLASHIGADPTVVAPYLYACVAIVSNYMIFGKEMYYEQPLTLIAESLRALEKRKGESA